MPDIKYNKETREWELTPSDVYDQQAMLMAHLIEEGQEKLTAPDPVYLVELGQNVVTISSRLEQKNETTG